MSLVRDLILIVVKVKHRSERSQIFNFSNSELKRRSECSQIFHFNISEERQRSDYI